MSQIITPVFDPVLEMQSSDDVSNYFLKLANLSDLELGMELSNVMTASHNLRNNGQEFTPLRLAEIAPTLKDLTDKTMAICISKFGERRFSATYADDLAFFKMELNMLNMGLSSKNLIPAENGKLLFQLLDEKMVN